MQRQAESKQLKTNHIKQNKLNSMNSLKKNDQPTKHPPPKKKTQPNLTNHYRTKQGSIKLNQTKLN